jgi:putative heme transporter
MPAEDLTLGTIDLRVLARRAALPAAAALALVLAIVVLGGPLQAFADALGRALDADPAWVVGAAAFELASFGGYVLLLWLVGRRASARLGLRETTQITLGGAAATRLLPTAGAGGAALTLWSLRKSGLSTRAATRTLLTFLVLLYSVFLGSVAVTGTLLAIEGEPLALTALPAALATLGMVLAVSAALLRPTGPGRVRVGAAVLGGAVRDAISHLRSFDARVLGAFAWWGFDMAVLWAMLHAFGSPPALQVVVLAYFLGQVGNTIPIPGAVSGGLVGALLAFGVDADLAIVSVLAYRAIAIWIPAPVGLVALSALRRTIAAWGREDEPVAVAPRPLPRERRPAWRPHEVPVRAAA